MDEEDANKLDSLLVEEPEEVIEFKAEPTVIVDGKINYSLFDPMLAVKIASQEGYVKRLFDKLKKGGQDLYDRVLEDPSLVDQQVESWKSKESATTPGVQGPVQPGTGGPAVAAPAPDTTITGPTAPAVDTIGPAPRPATPTANAPIKKKPVKKPNALEAIAKMLKKPDPPKKAPVAGEPAPPPPPVKSKAQIRAEEKIAEKIAKAGITPE